MQIDIKQGNSNNIKALIMASIGSMFECYDFMICAFLASFLIKIFFNGNSGLGIFTIFTIAFFTRPLGGLFWSHLGDKYGRKLVFSISMMSMIIPTLAIAFFPTGFAPTFNTIGFIMLRALQGFLVGGEFAGGVTFIAEIAPGKRRGTWVAFFMAVLSLGTLLASGVNLLLEHYLDNQAILAWGWRLPFVLSVLLIIITIYIRRLVRETEQFKKILETKQIKAVPFLALLDSHLPLVFGGFIIVCCSAAGITTFYTFLPQILKTMKWLDQAHILYLTTAGLAILCLVMPLFGYLSDRTGRKNVFMYSLLATTLGVGLFILALRTENFMFIMAAMLFSSLAFGGVNAIYCIAISELFPTSIRFTGVALCYTLGYSVCGGLLPIIYLKYMDLSRNFMLPFVTFCILTILFTVFSWRKKTSNCLA